MCQLDNIPCGQTPVISSALFTRLSSRGAEQFEDKVMSAMRHEFGGHAEKPAAAGPGT